MKNAFDSYFSKLNSYAKEKFGTKPTVSFENGIKPVNYVSAQSRIV